MTPTPQELGGVAQQAVEVLPPVGGDGVVISGMAGLYPQSRYVKDLENILYNKVNPVSSADLRWKYNHPEVAQYTGNVPDLDRFDAQFFKVHYRLGNSMDSMSRKILEQAYEAIYDAGVSPTHLSGKKVGVYIGTCFSETEKACFYVATSRTGFGIAGCSKAMFANRISYWLNAKGPSVSIDDACCSSTAALELAYKDIARGECEAAIVGGANLCLHPQSSVHYGRIMKISMDGKTKSFAEDAAGCAKSEAINVLFLQKAKDAKRIYAEVVYVKTEFVSILNGKTGPRYGFYRDPSDTVNFLNKFYKEAGVPPGIVEYVEAFGSAVPEVDKSELEAIDKVFCNQREEPLLVGSVMSNIGYGEAASGISAVTKVLLGYHRGELAANLHCETPRKDVVALQEGRMRVVSDNQRFQRTYTAVNSMSVTGINAHVLLYGHYKPKDLNRYKSSIPRLVTISGRQETSVQRVLDHLKTHPIDPEELALLHNIHETKIAGHLGKGFTILDTNAEQKTVSLSERAEYSDEVQRPLWFVYSGMGSQWAGMGAQLMRIPIFAAAIERCRKVLEPKGLDIVHIITSPDKTIFNNILHSFVGISAVQIGLTDILMELGLVPDKMIGHSVGELGCAYADGCLTAEEMILSAYSRGLVSLETPFIRGSMAAVGIGFEQMSKMCPPEIEIACHNSAESCTISGPAEAMRSFVADLTAKGIFAKEVPCSNIAYHSRYISEAGPRLLKYLKEVIKTPKARSERWLSTSVPQDSWDKSTAKYSSAEYHTNNLLSPVLFEETSRLIPPTAVLVEVAPHGLLQAILKRSLPQSCTNIPLTRRGHTDNVLMLLDAVGKLYMEGYNPKVRVLYPKVEFPVSTGTPYLSHFVDWAHQDKWSLPLFQSAHRTMAASSTFLLTIHDDEYSYLKGHVFRNKTLVPFSFALVAVWDTLAMSLNLPKKSLSVQFQEVHLYVQPILYDQKIVKLSVSLLRGNGWFEVMDGHSKIATGYINSMDSSKIGELSEELVIPKTNNNYELSTSDVYRLLYEREYSYSGEFRSIQSANESISEANILWNGNWVAFIEGIFQLNTLKYTHGTVAQPDRIGRLVIDVEKHLTIVKNNQDTNNIESGLEAHLNDVQNRSRCGGVLLENMRFLNLLPNKNYQIALQTLKFVPRFHSKIDISSSLHVILQIVAENISQDIINVIGLTSENDGCELFEEMEKIAENVCIPGIKVQYQQMKHNTFQEKINAYHNVDLILIKNLSKIKEVYQSFHHTLQTNTFIANEEELTTRAAPIFPSNLYNIVSVLKNAQSQLELARWKPTPMIATRMSAFTVRSNSDLPILMHARNTLPSQNGLIVLTSYPPVAGLNSLVKQWRKDSTRNCIYLIMVNENSNDKLGSDELPEVNLAYNIFENGSWGGEYYLPLEDNSVARDKIKLQSDTIGDLNSLRWVQAPELSESGTAVTVHYAGINVGDVNKALGVIANSNDKLNDNYGMEFSGITERGERVMGLVQNGATRSQVMAQPELMWPVPSYWSLEDAATVPFAYVLAYYCLVIKPTSRILTNNVKQYSVLVHGGAGALGQAAISVALARGYRVFTTVADRYKKRFLLKLFPELKEEDIGNSRDASFGDLVLSATNGFGCNVVICCLKGELKNTSLRCCGPSSTVLDTVQIPSNENYKFGMYNLTNERSYVAVDITSILSNPKSDELRIIHGLVCEGISLGHVRPLSRVTFALHETPRAFRLLAATRHRGRVLLRMTDQPSQIQPKFSSAADDCHVILCDSNHLGFQLADKLLDCGVKKLHLHLKTSVSHLQYKLRIWEKLGIEVGVTYGYLDHVNDVTNLLHSAMRLGPVEGLHVIADSPLQEPVIANLDLVTRTICPTLRHFMVLSYRNNCGHHTAIQRTKNGLPVTLLDLSMLETFVDADGGTWYFGAVEAAERALLSSHPVLLANQKQSSCLSLVQKIAALTDLNIGDATSNLASFEELGMQFEKSSLVCTFLRDMYNTSFDEKDIPLLTVKILNELEARTIQPNYQEVNGLGTFYSYVDPDELMATTEMVFLPTLTTNSSMRDDEFDVNETFLCIVPGLEGHHARFHELCERLKLQAFVLQPGLDHPDETLQELATRYSKTLLKKTGLKKSFYILGYETGVMVALELAAILEEHGQTGTVFCLGDGPDEVQALLELELGKFDTEEALQEGVVRHMFKLMTRGLTDLAENALCGCFSWSARIDACVRTLLGQVSHSAQYARALVEAAYARIGIARHYNAEPRALQSRLVLLRARRVIDGEDECSLQRYTQRALVVENLAAPMAHAASDLQVPAIINRYLDDEILQAFRKKNLCDTYLMNADAFMSSSENS